MTTSINFQNGNQQSIHFHTNKEENIMEAVEDYITELIEDTEAITGTQLEEKNPHVIILDFIIWYIGDTDGNEGDYELHEKPSTKHQTYNLTKMCWKTPTRP